jgi:secreted trypsin-like serine protease
MKVYVVTVDAQDGSGRWQTTVRAVYSTYEAAKDSFYTVDSAGNDLASIEEFELDDL